MSFIQLDYDTWFEKFKPITKPGTDHIAFDTHDDSDFLRTQPDSKIWTLIDCPGYNTAVIVNGYWRTFPFTRSISSPLRFHGNGDCFQFCTEQMKPLARIGRFLPLDENGRLVNDCPSVIAAPWNSVVDFFRQHAEQLLGHHMHSLYVRGSIACGSAISGVSDLDAFAVIKGEIDKSARKEWFLETGKKMKSAFPFCVGIDVDFLDHDLLLNSSQGADFRFLIKTQSTCIAGKDLRPSLESFAPDLSVAFGCRCLKKDLADFHRIFLEEVNSSEQGMMCTWMMRKLLRAAGEIAMLKQGRYSRDLYLCWEAFSEIYPFFSDEMQDVLHLAINPSTDLTYVANLVHRVTERLLIEFDIASSNFTLSRHEK